MTDLRQCWGTPRKLFEALHREYRFTIDACALPFNAKLDRYWSPVDDGLAQSWVGESVWCNPPFGEIGPWAEKAYWSTRDRGLAALLVPARADQIWWHEWAMRASTIFLLRGRVAFDLPPGIEGDGAGYREPIALLVFTPQGPSMEMWWPYLEARDAETGAVLTKSRPQQQRTIFEAAAAIPPAPAEASTRAGE